MACRRTRSPICKWPHVGCVNAGTMYDVSARSNNKRTQPIECAFEWNLAQAIRVEQQLMRKINAGRRKRAAGGRTQRNRKGPIYWAMNSARELVECILHP